MGFRSKIFFFFCVFSLSLLLLKLCLGNQKESFSGRCLLHFLVSLGCRARGVFSGFLVVKGTELPLFCCLRATRTRQVFTRLPLPKSLQILPSVSEQVRCGALIRVYGQSPKVEIRCPALCFCQTQISQGTIRFSSGRICILDALPRKLSEVIQQHMATYDL